MMQNLLAANQKIQRSTLDSLRGMCVREVKSLNGALKLDDAVIFFHCNFEQQICYAPFHRTKCSLHGRDYNVGKVRTIIVGRQIATVKLNRIVNEF